MKKIYLGADHAGFKLKEQIKKYFVSQNIVFEDLGNLQYDKNDNYPEFASRVAQKVTKNSTLGILCCGSAFGMVIVANKFKNVRAVAVNNEMEAKLSRAHNNANILCLAGGDLLDNKIKTVNWQNIRKIIDAWLIPPTKVAQRHLKRQRQIKKIEQVNFK